MPVLEGVGDFGGLLHRSLVKGRPRRWILPRDNALDRLRLFCEATQICWPNYPDFAAATFFPEPLTTAAPFVAAAGDPEVLASIDTVAS